VLPYITDILSQVDRQMLLVLKTNDLIRGIETTLETQNRMTAFWVMSKCCIKSIFYEKIHSSPSKWHRFTLSLAEKWTLFKLNLYYLIKGLINLNFLSTVKMLNA
jgi:aarF domain-containing kinase